MNRKKMRNPLQKRVPKELIGEWRKYLVIFLLLSITIGFVSGMYVANNSMLSAIDESVTKYQMEYGHFELNRKADAELLAKLESGEKADVWAYATETAREEADREIDTKSGEEAEKQAEKLLEESVKSGIEAHVKSVIEAQVQQMIPAGTPGYEDALKQAMAENYDAAVKQAMDENYEAALKQAMDENYEAALKSWIPQSLRMQ